MHPPPRTMGRGTSLPARGLGLPEALLEIFRALGCLEREATDGARLAAVELHHLLPRGGSSPLTVRG